MGDIDVDQWGERMGNMGISMLMAAATMPEQANILLNRGMNWGGVKCVLRQAYDGAGEICFTAGTPVSTAISDRKIETLQPGQRLLTEGTKAAADEAGDDPTDVDPATWRLITLRLERAVGNVFEARMLRPLTWIKKAGASVGAMISLSLPDIEVEGMAQVMSIEPCPAIQPGRGRVITATFTQLSSGVLSLKLRGQDKPLEPTRPHRFFSEDRDDWVPARDLRVNERLRTRRGQTAIVESISAVPGVHRVYNL